MAVSSSDGSDDGIEAEVLRLHALGWSVRAIARQTGLSRMTVHRALQRIVVPAADDDSDVHDGDDDDDFAKVAELLKPGDGVVMNRLHEWRMRSMVFEGAVDGVSTSALSHLDPDHTTWADAAAALGVSEQWLRHEVGDCGCTSYEPARCGA